MLINPIKVNITSSGTIHQRYEYTALCPQWNASNHKSMQILHLGINSLPKTEDRCSMDNSFHSKNSKMHSTYIISSKPSILT